MRVTILDTKTKKTAESEGMRAFDWEDGNWSCDCNRQNFFDLDDDEDEYEPGTEDPGVCIGELDSSTFSVESHSYSTETSDSDGPMDRPVTVSNAGELFEVFGFPDEDEDEYDGPSHCIGCHRFIIIKAEMEGPEVEGDRESAPTLQELNSDYPTDLLVEHGIEIR